MSNLETAVQLKAELDALRPLTSDQEQRIWQKFRFDWNYHSNNIEGNSLTFGETKSLLLHNITAQGKPLKDHIEITGHNEAISALIELTRGESPLTESFFRSLHTLILRERYQVDAQTPDGLPTKKWIEVGQYKTSPNHVLTVTGEIFRFAEPIEVPGKMQQLVAIVNALTGKTDGDALIAAAKAHYDLVLIHPFDDGNGRMARLLMNLILIKHGFPPAIIKTEDKANYFSALRQADGGQFDVFAEYISGCVCNSLEIMLAGARGEDIDEFDIKARQKILALERILETRGTHVKTIKSPEVIAKSISAILYPFRTIVNTSVAKFANLVTTIRADYFERISQGMGSFMYRPLASLEDIVGVAESGVLVLRIELIGVRSVGLSGVQKAWDITVEPLVDHLNIRCNPAGIQIDVRYDASVSDEQVRMVDQALTKDTIQWLEDATGIDVNKTLSSG